ncbi:Na(+)-translocating NADH-quinone reductase subunit A [Neisseriaceae bacterium TC5R-5]|nr:Na(+)-translocating NADH-quinone reductase subunit A [Neisseriaceae bacterium TC5R-5]
MIIIKKGLDLPILGKPKQLIEEGPPIQHIALLGEEYVGMRPAMLVQEGDSVKKGQALFEDKKNPGVFFTAPASGRITAILRGERRLLQAVVLAVSDDEALHFAQYDEAALPQLSSEQVRSNLLASGLWTALRTRPFSKAPIPTAQAQAIFVNAMDTQPLAADPAIIIATQPAAFRWGLTILSRLACGKVHVCHAANADLPEPPSTDVVYHTFAGPHPAGLVGTHIHFIEPVGLQKSVWHINYQDVIAIGQLFTTGELDSHRVIALAGSQVKQPRLLRTCLGANLTELCAGELQEGPHRIISGSVFNGTHAVGAQAYLGRFHLQVSVLAEDSSKELLGWLKPGADKFSITRATLGYFMSGQGFAFSTNSHGSERSMVPIGNYERVMPLDILPTVLLRDLLAGDSDGAQALGCLELDEEDLALCSFVCPSKYEYGPILRQILTKIEQEG